MILWDYIYNKMNNSAFIKIYPMGEGGEGLKRVEYS